VGRPGVSRAAGSDPPAGTASPGLRQPPLSPSRCRGRGRAGEKTGANRRCGPRSSIRSGSSSECLALPRCAIAGSKRTLIASSSPVRSPICSWCVGIYCAVIWRNLSGLATNGCGRHRHHTNNDIAHPTLSLAAAISMADIYSQLLVQTFLSTRNASR
jgi:hypothetical protein